MKYLLILISVFIILICFSSCSDRSYQRTPISQYIIGTWLKETERSDDTKDRLPVVNLTRYTETHKGDITYSFRQNKVFTKAFEGQYVLTDTSITYINYDMPTRQRFEYKIDRLSAEKFRMIAKFPVKGYSYAEVMDSIEYYTKLEDSSLFLEELVEKGDPLRSPCNAYETDELVNYWRLDSTETLTSMEHFNDIYFHFEFSGTGYAFSPLSPKKIQSFEFNLQDSLILFAEFAMILECIDSENLVYNGLPSSEEWGICIYLSKVKEENELSELKKATESL